MVVASTASAQDLVFLQRIEGPIQLDGFSDEPAWQNIDPVPLAMYEPISGGRMTERTEIRIGYDDDYLYVSGRMYDSEPDKIRGNTLYRDRYSGDDVFAIVLDTFNDNENALWFYTTPRGVRMDYADRKSTRLNSSHVVISYAVFSLKKKKSKNK